ncbi:hypothetical protein JYT44_03030 [Caldithrix abyssi]|nr:hypothetical protein [Caldithrix abyssi]
MARIYLKESIEWGNKYTGEYKRWTREAEITGSAPEISYLVKSISKELQLPGLRPNRMLNGNNALDEIISGLLKDRY